MAIHPSDMPTPPGRPWRVAIVGNGRVGGAYARALEASGHQIVARIGRDDDPSALTEATVVVIAVPDDAMAEAAAVVERLGRTGQLIIHTSGLSGLALLSSCGPLIAAIHPAVAVATSEQTFDGVTFGVTCPAPVVSFCEEFVADLGGVALFLTEEQRPLYHAALVMASNFAVSLAGDSADLLGGTDALVPLLRATVENIARLGADAALTGPIVRGDVGTVRAHLDALPTHLLEVYVANARRALARAVSSGRLDAVRAQALTDVLDSAMVR